MVLKLEYVLESLAGFVKTQVFGSTLRVSELAGLEWA